MGTEKTAKPESIFQKFRSPCIDAHYEAYILQSTWAVGKLYATNLYLGQSYVKQIQELEKQRQIWLSRKEKERETMQKRFEALKRKENGVKSCRHMASRNQISSLERLDFIQRGENFKHKRAASQLVRQIPRLGLQEMDARTRSGVPRSKSLNLPFPRHISRPTGYDFPFTPNSQRSSDIDSAAKSKSAVLGQELLADSDLIPRWLPYNLRLKHARGKIKA